MWPIYTWNVFQNNRSGIISNNVSWGFGKNKGGFNRYVVWTIEARGHLLLETKNRI
jgi:hypothetical protein